MKTIRIVLFGMLACFALAANAAPFNVDTLSANHVNTSPTTDGYVLNSQNTTKSAYSIYSPLAPAGWSFYDTDRSVLDLESGTTTQQGSAFGAYTYTAAPTGAVGHEANAVGYFVQNVDAADNTASWGINTSCDDNTVNGSATLTGRKCIGYEADFTINGNSTVEGIALAMNGFNSVANANAVQISRVTGSVPIWTYGFVTDDGAATTGLQIGAAAKSGTLIASQPVVLSYFNASSVEHQIKMQAFNDALNLTSNGTNDGMYFDTGNGNVVIGTTGSDSNINMQLAASGTGEIIATAPLQLPGYTVATLPGGQKGAEAYVTDATSCTFLGSVTGGGSTFYPVIFNGTAWVGH